MKRISFQQDEYILSREQGEQGEQMELVSVKTGKLLELEGRKRTIELPSQDVQVVPQAQKFEDRPRSFLSELRAERLKVLVRSRKAKAAARVRAKPSKRSKKKSDLELLRERFERERPQSAQSA